jgi:hypothetical protein
MLEHLSGLSGMVSSIQLKSKGTRRNRSGLAVTTIACQILHSRTNLTRRDRNMARMARTPNLPLLKVMGQGVPLQQMENFGDRKKSRIMDGMVMRAVRIAEDRVEGGTTRPTSTMLHPQEVGRRRRRNMIRKIGGRGLRMHIPSRRRVLGRKRRKRRVNLWRKMLILIPGRAGRPLSSLKMQRADFTVEMQEVAEGIRSHMEMTRRLRAMKLIFSPTSSKGFALRCIGRLMLSSGSDGIPYGQSFFVLFFLSGYKLSMQCTGLYISGSWCRVLSNYAIECKANLKSVMTNINSRPRQYMSSSHVLIFDIFICVCLPTRKSKICSKI